MFHDFSETAQTAWLGGQQHVRRTLDASALNHVANNPTVRPWLQGEGEIDLSSLVDNLANIALVADGGGFLLQKLALGEYEVHSMFLPDARGGAIAAMREGMEYMFTRTDCQRIVTKVPDDNQAAKGIARAGGFKPLFRREACWNGVGVTYMGVTIDQWACASPTLEAHGEWFHAKVSEATAGMDLPQHAHDPAHERAVGATVLIIRAGNIGKGVDFYNKWAGLAGYPPISVLTVAPTVLHLGLGIVAEVQDGNLKFLKCR